MADRVSVLQDRNGDAFATGLGVIDAHRGTHRAAVGLELTQCLFAVAEHALRIGGVERQTGEELGGHTATTAGIETAAGTTRSRIRGFTQFGEQIRGTPHRSEAPSLMNGTGFEVVVQNKRAGIHIANRINETDNPAGTAEVEPGQRLAKGGEMEEGIAGEHMGAGQQPVVQLDLLGTGGMQLMPGVDAATRGTEAGRRSSAPYSLASAS